MASSLNDFIDLSADELRSYLRQRGQPCSGIHSVLAARALIAHEQRLPLVLSAESLTVALKKDYLDILSENSLPLDPFDDKILWIDDITRFPTTNIGQTFDFILRCKAFSTEYVGQYKIRKAFSFFMSGFVDKIVIFILDDKRIIAKTSVLPSQRINDEKHKLWILFSQDGCVSTACCSCVAGLSKCCNHVVATLYKISYANENGFTDPACTELPCVWNSSCRDPEPMKIRDMDIVKNIAGKKHKRSMSDKKDTFDPRADLDKDVNECDKNRFLQEIRGILPNSVLNISYTPPLSEDVPPSLFEISNAIQNEHPTASPDSLLTLFNERLSFNDSQISELEKVTRTQAISNVWLEQRKGRITASNFHDVYTKINTVLRKGGKPVNLIPLIQNLMSHKDIGHLPQIKWGRENEQNAAEAFMAVEGKKHVNPKLNQCGLFLFKSHPYLGATPDNIFSCKCPSAECPNEFTIEYKCPYDILDEDFHAACMKTKFLEKKGNEFKLKRTHKYYTQIIGQLALTGCKEGYFLVWYPKTEPFLERITFDEKYWSKVLNNLILFFKSYLQELLLGIVEICVCPICDKPCLNKDNLNVNEKSILCNSCRMNFHVNCFPAESELCQFCNVNHDEL